MLSLSASSQVPQTTFASHNSQLGKLDVYGVYIYTYNIIVICTFINNTIDVINITIIITIVIFVVILVILVIAIVISY